MKTQILLSSLWKKYQTQISMILGYSILLSVSYAANANVNSNSNSNVDANENRVICRTDIHQGQTQKQVLSEKWGVEVVAMRSTAAGHMVDFRYRVLDAEKAAPLFERRTKPYLIHQQSGKSLAVPNTAKLGALRNSNTPKAGRTYWMFFGNNGGLVKKGDKVTVAIGDFRATDINVE